MVELDWHRVVEPVGSATLNSRRVNAIEAFQTHGLDFRYSWRRRPVFNGLTHTFASGACVVLGPNGAGKSTLLALMASALRPSRGTVEFGSLSSARRRDRGAYRRTVGWMPQMIRPVPGLTAREQVAYAGWLKGMPSRRAWEQSRAALDNVRLGDRANTAASTLSGGQLRRLGLAEVLVHEPRAMLLDEPTAGLDPAQRIQFRALMAEVASRTTLVVSTHLVEDIAGFFDQVAVLAGGQFVFSGPLTTFAGPNPGADAIEASYLRALGDQGA